jgi:hypothetical protein
MSRPTRPEYLENPIRKLREILAMPGVKHLSQIELSAIVDIPRDSLNSCECGRMTFSVGMQNRILCETGAAWNANDKRWRFWKSDGPLYTREHFIKYRELLGSRMEKAMPLDSFLAALRIKLLLEALPPKARFKFLFRLNTFLEENRKEFCPKRFAALFEDATGYVEAHPETDRDHPMTLFRGYPQRLAPVFTAIGPETISWFVSELDQTDFELKPLKQPQPRAKSGESKTKRGPRRA